MSESTPPAQGSHEPQFSDPADTAGKSRIWLPILAAMFLFVIAAAAVMLFASLGADANLPQAPAGATPAGGGD